MNTSPRDWDALKEGIKKGWDDLEESMGEAISPSKQLTPQVRAGASEVEPSDIEVFYEHLAADVEGYSEHRFWRYVREKHGMLDGLRADIAQNAGVGEERMKAIDRFHVVNFNTSIRSSTDPLEVYMLACLERIALLERLDSLHKGEIEEMYTQIVMAQLS